VPKAIIDGSHLPPCARAPLTAIRREASRPQGSRVLGHIAAALHRLLTVRLRDHLFCFDESACTSRSPESATPSRCGGPRDLGKPVRATEDCRTCVEGSDIVCGKPRALRARSIAEDRVDQQGALGLPYGT